MHQRQHRRREVVGDGLEAEVEEATVAVLGVDEGDVAGHGVEELGELGHGVMWPWAGYGLHTA